MLAEAYITFALDGGTKSCVYFMLKLCLGGLTIGQSGDRPENEQHVRPSSKDLSQNEHQSMENISDNDVQLISRQLTSNFLLFIIISGRWKTLPVVGNRCFSRGRESWSCPAPTTKWLLQHFGWGRHIKLWSCWSVIFKWRFICKCITTTISPSGKFNISEKFHSAAGFFS